MSKNRIVNTKFWDDEYIAKLDPIEKLLFLYILTNPLTNICGIYEIQSRRIAFDTGIDKEMVEKILQRFQNDKKVLYEGGRLGVKNFIKHQTLNPKVEQGIRRELELINKDFLDRLSIDYDSLSHLTKPNLTKLNLTYTVEEVALKNLLTKYLEIKEIDNQTNRRYIKSLLNYFKNDMTAIENLLKAVKYFEKTPYPYVIFSAKSLYEKKEKIIARVKQEQLCQGNKGFKTGIV